MPENDSQNTTLLGGFDFLKKLGLGRVKRIDPVDSDLQTVQKGQVIGTVSKGRKDKIEKTVINIPYSSDISCPYRLVTGVPSRRTATVEEMTLE